MKYSYHSSNVPAVVAPTARHNDTGASPARTPVVAIVDMVLPPRSSAVPTAALVALFLAHRNSTEAQAGVNSMQRSTALNDLISLSRFSNGRNSKLFSPYLAAAILGEDDAALSLGCTFSASRTIERRASAGSVQSLPA